MSSAVPDLEHCCQTRWMFVNPITEIACAYQLHYYLCFRTYRRQQFFSSEMKFDVLRAVVSEICKRHDYHLLKNKIYPDQVRCLISLSPHQSVSNIVRIIKANASRECGLQLKLTTPVWAEALWPEHWTCALKVEQRYTVADAGTWAVPLLLSSDLLVRDTTSLMRWTGK